MNKPQILKKGDKVAIVSLSSGILGESFCAHQIKLGTERLKTMGLEVVFMPNSLKGMKYIEENPEKRAEDLKNAFSDPEIKGIICAIGGEDGFKIFPYLMENEEFKKSVKENPKIFTGFSDTTNHHLMFYKLGLQSFYGPSFLTDFAELDKNLLPYTENFINIFFGKNIDDIISSEVWYEERTDFSEKSLYVPRISHKENRGFELFQGNEIFSGELLGGCLESLYYLLSGERYTNQKTFSEKYGIFPPKDEWKGKILFVETSEKRPVPEKFGQMLNVFKNRGLFEEINGIIVGKPQNEVYYDEYKEILIKTIDNPDLPILYNVNFGHSYPRCILPYGLKIEYIHRDRKIYFRESLFAEQI